MRDPQDLLLSKIKTWAHEKEIRALCKGEKNKLKVGKISKVILGIRVDPEIKRIVEDSVSAELIVNAKLDFVKNTISAL